MSDLWIYVLGGVLAIWMVWRDERSREPTPPDLDRMNDKERAKALAGRQEAARARMKELGIKSLLEGRPAWRKIVEMGAAPLQHQDARVLTMKRRKA